jgi:hypothetical protein
VPGQIVEEAKELHLSWIWPSIHRIANRSERASQHRCDAKPASHLVNLLRRVGDKIASHLAEAERRKRATPMSFSFEEARHIFSDAIPNRVPAYFDQTVLFALRLEEATVRQLEKAGFEVRDRDSRQPGKKLSIKQPSRSALRLVSSRGGELYSTELALDPSYENPTLVRQAMKPCICQPRAGDRRVVDLGGALYTGQRKRGRHHHFAMYGDKPSRITGESDTVHLEKRIQGLQLLRKIGIKDGTDMRGSSEVQL